MTTVDPDSLLLVGTCGPPHGVRGEIKVIPETDEPERLADLGRVFVGHSSDRVREYAVEGVRMQPTKRGTVALVRLEGLADREAADALRGYGVWADVSDLPALDDGEVYLHDLVGLAVVTEDGDPVGTVDDVMLGAQNLLIVKRPGTSDLLVPDVDEIVIAVDLDAETVTIRPPEGLLDL